MVGWHVDGTTSIDVDADLNRRRESMSATLWNSSARYGGAVECRQRYVSTANLNSIRCGTRSRSVGRKAADWRPITEPVSAAAEEDSSVWTVINATWRRFGALQFWRRI